MTGLTTILAATDLSSDSTAPLERGALIAKAVKAHYDVMHATGRDVLGPLNALLGESSEAFSCKGAEKAREQLTRFVSDICRGHEVHASVHVEPGPAATAIRACAEACGADLIVLGAHGHGFLSRLALGSIASRVVQDSGGRPVLVVKDRPRHAFQRVLVAVDFSPVSESLIRLARQVAPGAHLILLHVFDEPMFEETMEHTADSDYVAAKYKERAKAELQKLAGSASLSPTEYTGLVTRGEAKREILAHKENYKCDLVVMGKHGTHAMDEFLLGSVTNGVLAESQSDVLIVVDEREPAIWSYSGERTTTRLLRSERFDVSAWGAAASGPLSSVVDGAMGKAITAALRDAFARDNAIQFDFGATILDADIEARPTDLIMTLPFGETGEPWQGPLLVISLENIVKELIDALDFSDDGLPDAEGIANLRSGFHMLANRTNKALFRNARKIDRQEERKAPLW